MRLDERLGLARQAYQRALSSAREQSTRTSWLRLLTASRNLEMAKKDRERRTRPARSASSAAREVPEQRGATLKPPPAVSPAPPGPRERVTPPTAAPEPPHDASTQRERSRVLREQARALVTEARVLRARALALATRARALREELAAIAPM